MAVFVVTTICIAVRQRNPSPGNPIQKSEPTHSQQKVKNPTFPIFLFSNTIMSKTIHTHITNCHPFSLFFFFNPLQQFQFSTPIFQMGCCISKCRPHHQQHPLKAQLSHVQDKLVISHSTTTPIPIPKPNQNPIPHSPTSSASSFSSFASNTILSSASSLSTASSSSSLSSKDRSFSNDFLLSCYKHNPHILRINSLKEANSLSLPPTKPHLHINHINPKSFMAPPPKVSASLSSMPHKRLRSTSPTNLTRNKSMRKEAETPDSNSTYNLPTRTLRSPSPSRRFQGANNTNNLAISNRKTITPKATRKENVKAASPNRSFRGSKDKENNPSVISNCRVGSKMEESIAKEEDYSPMDVMEDINNPLISLDCFIFL